MVRSKKGSAKSESKSLTAYLEDIKFGNVSMEDVLKGSSRNIEAIADANRTIIDGYTDLAKRQYEMLKEFIDQVKELAGDDYELSDKLKSILDTAKKDVQDLQKIATTTNSQAQEILKKRTRANVDAWKRVIEETRARITKKEKKAGKPAAHASAAAKPAAARKAPVKKAPVSKAAKSTGQK